MKDKTIGAILWFITVVAFFGLASHKANALGQTEEGILYGLGIYKVWDIINDEQPWEPDQTYGYESGFPPFRCSGDSIKCAYERGAYEREREEWEDKKTKAYECGRTGRNCEE